MCSIGVQGASCLCQANGSGGAQDRAVGAVDANLGLDVDRHLSHAHRYFVARLSLEGVAVHLGGQGEGSGDSLTKGYRRDIAGVVGALDEQPIVPRVLAEVIADEDGVNAGGIASALDLRNVEVRHCHEIT